MSHPSSAQEQVGDLTIDLEAFKKSAWVYKSIGAEVSVHSEETYRSWKCLWLCRRNRKADAEFISLECIYYTKVDGSPLVLQSAHQFGEWEDRSEAELKHYAVGFGVKIKFPGGGSSPSTLDDLLPVDGVVAEARVRVDGRSVVLRAAAGSHPA